MKSPFWSSPVIASTIPVVERARFDHHGDPRARFDAGDGLGDRLFDMRRLLHPQTARNPDDRLAEWPRACRLHADVPQ